MATRARPPRSATASGQGVPVSLRLPARLRQRVKRFAAARDLQEATAIRTLAAERLDELEMEGELRAAEAWQLRQAIRTWHEFRAGGGKVVPTEAVDRIFEEARTKRRERTR